MSQQRCLAPRVLPSEGCKTASVMRRRVTLSYSRPFPQRRLLVSIAALKGVLCDLDGVIYSGGHASALPGAAETIRYFRDKHVPWLFVTNTNTKPRSGLAAKLREMGIPCNPDDIVTPAKLAADWLRTNNVGPAALFIAPELQPEFEGIPQLSPTAESGAAAVVIGDMGLDWNYASINRAFRLVMEGTLRSEASGLTPPRPSCDEANQPTHTHGNGNADQPCSVWEDARPATGPLTVISLGKGRYYKDTDGYSIDVGPFTAAVEFASDQKAVVLGKPDPLIFCLASKSLGLKPEEVVMIGDDVRGDVGGAQAAGLQGVLVRTGKFREHDLHVGVTPNAVLDSIADLPSWWETQHPKPRRQQRMQQMFLPGLVGAQLAALVSGRAAGKRSGKALVNAVGA